jgi:hypothetical protein
VLENSSVTRMSSEFMYAYDFLYDPGAIAAQPLELATVYHASGIGQVFARSGWDADATFVHVSGGPYTESHDHHDEGSFLLYRGEWLAYDANVESGSGIHAEADCHNLVRLERDGQTVPMDLNRSAEMIAVHRGPGFVHTAIDVAPVFEPDEGVARLERELVWLAPDVLVVFDRVDGGGADAIWQLNSPLSPTVAGTRASFAGAAATLEVERVLPAAATATVRDWPTLDDDMDGGYRLDVAGGAGTFLHVLWVDGAATAVTPSDGDGRLGVAIQYGGGTAVVRFSPDGFDATLDLGDGTIALGPGIDSLAER